VAPDKPEATTRTGSAYELEPSLLHLNVPGVGILTISQSITARHSSTADEQQLSLTFRYSVVPATAA
jgi:hypothetical protein